LLAVIVSLGSSGLGIPVLIGVVVELSWRGEWRRWFVVVVPAVLYGLWYLHYGEDEITKNGLINSPGFAEDIAAAAFGGIVGRGLGWGRPIALIGFLALLRVLARSVPISARLVGLLATGISLWMLTAVARSTISTPETGRYVYLGAIVIVLVGVELLREVAINPPVLGVGALAVAISMVTSLTALHNGAITLRGTSKTVTAELGALELAANRAPSGYQPDTQRAPQIIAGPYLHTVRAIRSSPADTPAEIAAADPISRAAADSVLVALDAPALLPLRRTKLSPLAPVPIVTGLVSGQQIKHGDCIDLVPLSGATIVGTFILSGSGATIRDQGAGSVAAALKRFGESFIPLSTEVAPQGAAALSIVSDAAQLPWQLQLTSSSPLSICGLSA
jgi:hypothetical protein